MRTEYEIKKELEEKRATYRAGVDTLTITEGQALTQEIYALMAELSAAISEGANDCPECGTHPHGIKQPKYYEVGCLSCHRQSKGDYPQEAVENWNNGVYFLTRRQAQEAAANAK